MPFATAVSMLIGSFIMGAIIAPDVTRYARDNKAAAGGMAFGMLVGFPIIMILAGIMVAGAGGEADFSKIMLANQSAFWRLMAVSAIVLAAWTTNDNNLYSGSLAINAMFPRLKKWTITVFSGALGTLLALLGINTSEGFQLFLGLLAIGIPPAAAIMMTDFLFFRGPANKEYRGTELDHLPLFRALPVACWALGTLVGFLSQYTTFRITQVVALDAMLVGAVAYLIVNRRLRQPANFPQFSLRDRA